MVHTRKRERPDDVSSGATEPTAALEQTANESTITSQIHTVDDAVSFAAKLQVMDDEAIRIRDAADILQSKSTSQKQTKVRKLCKAWGVARCYKADGGR
jgi:pyruvate/oxaloacetate carboxyltransferase